MKIGDFVKVKDGLKNPDYNVYDISGWAGKITGIIPSTEPEYQNVAAIEWDTHTISNLPYEFVERSILEAYSFSEMSLGDTDLIIYTPTIDSMQGRKEAIWEWQKKIDADYFNVEDQRYFEILSSKDLGVTLKNLTTYRNYLIPELKGIIYLTGIEDFSWEEGFVMGWGSKEEYAKMKKTHPSYTDTFKFIKILQPNYHPYDLIVKVKRESDGKTFELPLSDLKVKGDGKNHDLLHEFSVWVVNYQ